MGISVPELVSAVSHTAATYLRNDNIVESRHSVRVLRDCTETAPESGPYVYALIHNIRI